MRLQPLNGFFLFLGVFVALGDLTLEVIVLFLQVRDALDHLLIELLLLVQVAQHCLLSVDQQLVFLLLAERVQDDPRLVAFLESASEHVSLSE